MVNQNCRELLRSFMKAKTLREIISCSKKVPGYIRVLFIYTENSNRKKYPIIYCNLSKGGENMDKLKLIFHYWCKGTMKAINKTTYCSKLPTTSELLEEINAVLLIHSVFDSNVDKASVTVYEAYQSGDNAEAENSFSLS